MIMSMINIPVNANNSYSPIVSYDFETFDSNRKTYNTVDNTKYTLTASQYGTWEHEEILVKHLPVENTAQSFPQNVVTNDEIRHQIAKCHHPLGRMDMPMVFAKVAVSAKQNVAKRQQHGREHNAQKHLFLTFFELHYLMITLQSLSTFLTALTIWGMISSNLSSSASTVNL